MVRVTAGLHGVHDAAEDRTCVCLVDPADECGVPGLAVGLIERHAVAGGGGMDGEAESPGLVIE